MQWSGALKGVVVLALQISTIEISNQLNSERDSASGEVQLQLIVPGILLGANLDDGELNI
ncbi:MAG: hypothetical protein CVT85_10375 [Alphaproteobacteria bacterium HGW-Alphaproteobacteria-7]|jgi:hypothetical protein|nr:MAG: hypothetical protein CVT85_10375 [Alphaproteobacteria bacterium HGW-Alphaproteobacteria-7]